MVKDTVGQAGKHGSIQQAGPEGSRQKRSIKQITSGFAGYCRSRRQSVSGSERKAILCRSRRRSSVPDVVPSASKDGLGLVRNYGA